MTLDDYLLSARQRIDPLGALRTRRRRGQGGDPRRHPPRGIPHWQREDARSAIIDRNVLLRRLSPSSATRSFELSTDSRVIVFCNDGYASSIAATQLQNVGLPLATDLVGGYNAWKNAHA